jgi:hypothetical protein
MVAPRLDCSVQQSHPNRAKFKTESRIFGKGCGRTSMAAVRNKPKAAKKSAGRRGDIANACFKFD